jgi:glucose/arabinose dehydrogenase
LKLTKKRSLLLVLAALVVVALIGAAVIYRLLFFDPNNFRPILSAAGEADLQLPPGFKANVFAEGLSSPRFVAFGPDGHFYVAERGEGRIIRLEDSRGDGVADKRLVFADDISQPHSLVFHEGAWYVGVPNGVIRLVDENGDGTADSRQTIIGDIPPTGQHTTRTVAFLPDGRMVLSVGSSCNVCNEDDPSRAAVLVYDDADGGIPQVYASGLRNAVGLAVHPETGELWATNNGADGMGDNRPPDDLYIIQEGQDYGWPRCHSGEFVDPNYGSRGDCDGVSPPLVQLEAHSAPLGLSFYTGSTFPSDYQGDLFIAFHGSWNRSDPSGYKIGRLPLNDSDPAGPVEDFATGWLSDDKDAASGRPVGLAISPAGDLYVSDDKGGFIYRISYTGD